MAQKKQRSEEEIALLFVRMTLHVEKDSGVVVRPEFLILTMYAVVKGLIGRFGERASPVTRLYAVMMRGSLVNPGLSSISEIEKRIEERFREYDEIHKQYAQGAEAAFFDLNRAIVDNVFGGRSDNVEEYFDGLALYTALCRTVDETIDREEISL